jgi:hypothetical protein
MHFLQVTNDSFNSIGIVQAAPLVRIISLVVLLGQAALTRFTVCRVPDLKILRQIARSSLRHHADGVTAITVILAMSLGLIGMSGAGVPSKSSKSSRAGRECLRFDRMIFDVCAED